MSLHVIPIYRYIYAYIESNFISLHLNAVVCFSLPELKHPHAMQMQYVEINIHWNRVSIHTHPNQTCM